jgi:hypothetical protein
MTMMMMMAMMMMGMMAAVQDDTLTLVLKLPNRKPVIAAGEAAPPPLKLRPLCPDSMFTTRGPEQVVSHTHFTLTLLHVLVVPHIV